MANQASFHAKISADARQFVEQVNEAAEALQGLVNAQDKAGGAGTSKARSKASSAKKEQKGSEKQAEAALDKLHSKQMQNIRKENQARQQGVRKERGTDAMPGPARGFSEEASLVSRRAETEAKVARQLMVQKAATQAAFNEARKIKAERERALALEKKLVSQGVLQEGTLKDQERTVENLERIQKEYNDRKKQQLNRERSIAKANREQLDAMVTGRYALYDMANAYRGIAENAFRMARATASTLIKVAEFESAFTAVERAASLQIGTEAFNEVRQSLIDLSREIPVAFAEISEIATLGAQMGIATGDLADFTEQIAAFSAVTGATIDDTAEKFGRISSLANVPTEEFENLASSVLFAGFNAVATEKEILSMAESIAAAAANSGYAADQVIGLSTALASLGIRPEQARGVILRLFNDINRAVEGTSDKLGSFANVLGVSAESARNLFKTDAEGFFTAFLSGLSEVENLTGTLDELGIVNTREINVLQRLSGNMDVYTKSIREASESYAEGTALAEIYADTADNLEAKFQRLVNAFEALQAEASAGFGEGLKPIIEGLVDLTAAATEFAKSGFGRSIIPVVTVFAALTAAFAGIRFVGSIATAQLLAMRTAVLKMGEAGNVAAKPFRGLINAISGNVYVTDLLTGRTQFLTKAQIESAVASENLTRAQADQILTSQRATVATRFLSGSMAVLGGVMGVAMVASIGAMAYQMTRFNLDITKTGASINQLSDAVRKDTEAYENGADAIAVHTKGINTNSDAALTSSESANLVVDGQGKVAASFIDTTEKIEANTIALGENYKQLILNSLVASEEFQKFYDSANESGINALATLDEMNLGFDEIIQAAANDPGSGAMDALESEVKNFVDTYTADEIFGFARGDAGSSGQQALATLATAMYDVNTGARVSAASTKFFIDQFASGMSLTKREAEEFAGAVFKIIENIDSVTSKATGISMLEKALGLGTSAMEEFGDESEETDKKLSGLSKTMRTVLDYSNDIGGIFDRIMGIEFGEIQAQDDISDGWEKIAEKAADAQEAMREANLEIKDLEADKGVLEYQLSVAERYGDEQRAAVIRSKLAKTNEKLADEEKKFNDAQTESEMGLEGNSKAARENRDALIGLVGEYGNLIQAAIDAGMEGQELEDYIRDLKEEFIEQAEGVGFSRSELVKYEDIFDGFISTVDKVDPRVDIKFDSNISAAEQAFDEYMAKLRAANGYTTTQKFKTEVQIIQPYSLKPIVMGSDVRLFRYGLQQGKLTPFQYYKMVYGMDPKDFAKVSGDTSYLYQGRANGGLIGEMNNGGMVRGPGGPKSDIIPTMLSNGEYVIQASAVGAYGLDFMNALNQQRIPMGSMSSNTGGSAQGGGSNIVYLSPQDRALLRQVADRPVNLYADNGKIAQSANAGNVMLSQRGLN